MGRGKEEPGEGREEKGATCGVCAYKPSTLTWLLSLTSAPLPAPPDSPFLLSSLLSPSSSPLLPCNLSQDSFLSLSHPPFFTLPLFSLFSFPVFSLSLSSPQLVAKEEDFRQEPRSFKLIVMDRHPPKLGLWLS